MVRNAKLHFMADLLNDFISIIFIVNFIAAARVPMHHRLMFDFKKQTMFARQEKRNIHNNNYI